MKTHRLSTLFVFFTGSLFSQVAGPALVRHAPVLDGTVVGSVQILLGESINLNSTTNVSEDLLVPGMPTVVLNGTPTYGGTQVGAGSVSPSNYRITLSSGSTLRHVVRRIDPISLPAVPAPPSPVGNRSVSINSPNGSPGNFGTLRNLTLNSNVGLVAVPEGSYGNFSANSGSGFTLGVQGAATASTYNFQNLTVNSGSMIQIVGPVVINLANGFAGNGTLGDATNPAWLKLNLSAGSFTLNSGSAFYGSVNASNPKSAVTINANSRLVGSLTCDRLTINNGGLLQLAAVVPNLAPTVSLTSPIANAVLTAPSNVVLQAAAADADGAVTKVEFFQGSMLLGQDTTAPYQLTWSEVAAGSFILSAKATDNSGATTTSGAVTVLVNAPPTATLIAPGNNSVLNFPTTITLEAVATDPDGSIARVEFHHGATLIGQAIGAPFQLIWTDVPAGSYAVTATAIDSRGAATTSGTVSFVVNSRPTVALIAPANNATAIAPASFTLTAQAADSDGAIASVEFYNATTKIGTSSVAPYQFVWSNVPAGSHTLTAVAADNHGATATSSPIVVRVDPANVPPVAVLTAPANGYVFHGPASFVLMASASDADGSVERVRFYRDALLIGESTAAPFQFAITDLVPGSYSFTAKATDNSGASTISAAVSVIVNALPVVVMSASVSGNEATAPASFALAASASDPDGSIVQIEFYRGETKLGTRTAPPYTFEWTDVPAGTYLLSAVATDNRGGSAVSSALSVEVAAANVPPTIALIAPDSDAVYAAPGSFTLIAEASAGDSPIAKVEFFNGTIKVGESSAAPYAAELSGLTSGSHRFLARATDEHGFSAESDVRTILVNDLPTVAIIAPTNGASYVSPAVVALAVSAGDLDGNVVKVEYFADATKIGESASSPFQVLWRDVLPGNYEITARATDNLGGSVTSMAVAIDVADNVPPSVALVSPAEGARFVPPATITLAATAADADGTIVKVEFFEGETKLGESLESPFGFTWSGVPSGSYHFSAKATDNLGAAGNSIPLNIGVNALPVANAQSVSTAEGTPVAVSLTGSDLETPAASLTFAITAQPAHGVLSGSAPNLFYSPTADYAGSDSFTFTVFDGTESSLPGTINLSINSLNSPPAVNAGTDQRIGVSIGDGRNQVILAGLVTDDGRPNPPGTLTHVWTQAGGPQPVVIDSPGSLSSAVRFGPSGEGTALHFAAAADSVILPSTRSFHPGPAFSWEMWFRCDGVPTGADNSLALGQTMMCAADGASGQDIYLGFGSPFSPSRALSLVVDDQGSQETNPVSYYPAGGFQSGVWYHVIATRDYPNQRTRLYVNGVLRAEVSSPKAPIGRAMNMSLGRWWDGGNLFNHFVGSLDEVRIYDRELTDAEVAEHYGQGIGQYGLGAPNLIGGWHFDEASSITPSDFSQAHRIVTTTGSPTSVPGIVPGGGAVEAPGVYTFRLSADDGAAGAFDDVVITVNHPPTISAGQDQTIISLSQGAMLMGSVVDDNVPFGMPTVAWSVVDGPGQVYFANPNTPQTSTSFSAEGIYVLKLSATDGWIAVADTVEIRVGVLGSVEPPSGIVAWWPANGELHEVVQGNHDVEFLPRGVSYGQGKVSQAFMFDGGQVGQVLPHPDLDIGASSAGLTVELWVKPGRAADGQWLVRWSGSTAGVGLQQNYAGTGWYVYLRDTAGQDHTMNIDGGVFAIGTWAHIAMTYDRAAGMARMYKDGNLIKEQVVGVFTPQTAQPFILGQNYEGALDEIALYARPLTSTEVQAIHRAGAAGKSPPDDNLPPTVDAGPDLRVLSATGAATLDGTVSDDGKPSGGTLTIRWSQVQGPGAVIFGNENADKTTATFTVPGLYLLRLDANDGLHSAAGDTMEVRVGVTNNVKPAPGLAAWWPANGELHEVVRGNHDVEFLPKGVSYGTGKVLQAFAFDGGDVGRIAAHADLDLGASPSGLTVELWVKAGRAGDGQWLVRWNGSTAGVGLQQNYAGTGWYAYLRDTAGLDHTLNIDGGVFPIGTWIHVAMTYDRVNGIARMYRNGVLMKEQTVGVFTPQTAQAVSFGQNYQGELDEIAFYSRPLALAEVQAIYQAGSAGKSPPDDNIPPTVNAGPDVFVSSLAATATLDGNVSDDGKPIGGVLAIRWSQVEGPGTTIFADENTAKTTVTFTAAGLYLLKLDASDGLQSASSDLMEVRVGETNSVESASGIAAWWPGNGELREIVRGDHDVEFLPKGVAYGTGKVSQTFLFDGGDVGRISAHAHLDIGASPAGLTVELWVKPARAGDGQWLLRWIGTAAGLGLQQNYAGTGWYVYLRDTTGVDHTLNIDGGVFAIGDWTHVAMTYDRATGVAKMFKNGSLIKAQAVGVFTPETSQPLYFGQNYQGALDEITLYTRPLTSAEVQAIYTAGAWGKSRLNTAPNVNAGPDLATKVGMPLWLAGSASDDGFPNPPAALTYLWTQISGPGFATFSEANAVSTNVTFDLAGTYNMRLSASDSALNGSDDITVTVAAPTPPVAFLTSPANNAVVVANVPMTLTATAEDADGTVTRVEFFDGSTKLGEDVSAPYSLLIPSGFPVGLHSLTVKATDSSGLAATSDPVIIVSESPLSLPPTISLFEPGSSLGVGIYFEIAATATDSDGTIAKVEFFQGGTKLGEQTLPQAGHPTTYFWPMNGGLPAGTYNFSAVATDNAGASATSAPVTLVVSGDSSTAPEIFIATPDEDSRVSAPTEVVGVIRAPGLTSWTLQYRLRPAGDDTTSSPEPWFAAATGALPVGTAATADTAAVSATIGTFDPTRLINGLYELRVQANTVASTFTTAPIAWVVEGNMKIGAFSLAFEDLKLPLAGIPITITRTYDSRDARVGDFGPGWRLALANVRVQKNRNLGLDWFQTLQSGSTFQFYYVEPQRERLVTVTMPDGESHRFRAGAFVKWRDQDPDAASFARVVRTGKIRFYPVGDTTATLEPLDAASQLMDGFYVGGTGVQTLTIDDPSVGDAGITFNPTRFRLTTKEGTVFIVDETLGLLSMNDLSGNALVLNRDPANRVTGVTSTQNTPGGSIAKSVTIHRDATGRVDYIRDPSGRDLDYGYDAQNRLTAFGNRENEVTQFRYENASFPFYLTGIIDPRGTAALRSEFDANGRLIKQIDADGKETVFSRGADIGGRFEKVKDRLGNETTFHYDDRGNITLKVDPLGAQTIFSYYPDSDWVKFETDHFGNVKAMARDGRGNVIVETTGANPSEDPANPTIGHVTRMEYNGFSAPTRITDPDGRVQTFTYDALTNDLLTHTVGAGGSSPATTSYTYNADGTPATIADALGNVTNNTYNYAFSDPAYPGAVKQISMTVADPAGSAGSDPANSSATVLRVTRNLVDAQENQLAQISTRTLPDGAVEEVITRHRYDSENRLVATIMPDGRVTETRYTVFGKNEKSVLWRSLADYEAHDDSTARVTSHGYDPRGNLIATTHADGTSETTHYDAENRRDWSQDRRGNRTAFGYDAVGRLTVTILPDATPADSSDNPRTRTVYDLIGRATDVFDELGHRTQTIYFPDGTPDAMRRQQMVQIRALGNLVTQYSYDAAGSVRFVTDPRGNSTETVSDDQGRPRYVIHPATDEQPATQTETRYDRMGRRVARIDQEGKVTRYHYDGLGRLLEVRQYLDQSLAASDEGFALAANTVGLASTRYSYDELGNQRTQTDALGRVTTYHTDSLGRRTKRILPKDPAEGTFLTEQVEYDQWGNLWKRTDFAGKTTTFAYDALNRLKSKSADPTHPSLGYSHAIARVEYGYDAEGLRSGAKTYNASNTILYTETTPHDERGRLESKDSNAGQLAYSYYANGLLKDTVSASVGDGLNVGYRYDELNRLEFIDDGSTGLPMRSTHYSYNANGSLETLTQANAVTHTYSYDALNRLRTLNVTLGAAFLHAYEYRHNASGHRRQVIEGLKVTAYSYDGIYRLTNESISADPNSNNGAVGYGLDKVGNRSSRSSTLAAVPDQSNAFNARDWLASDTYTANGSTVQGATAVSPAGTATETYDFEERLILRTRTDGTSINLSYDGDGNRVRKTIFDPFASVVSSTAWLVDSNNLTGYAQVVEERSSTGGAPSSSKVYTYGSRLISQASSVNGQPSTISYYVCDGGNSVRELSNETGAITDHYDYDAFGNLIFRDGTTVNAYLYRGEQYDADLGLYFLRARYLNPASGRFWTQDSYEGRNEDPMSLNKYLYANADPVGHRDPSGNFSLCELQTAVSIGLGTLARIAIPAVGRFLVWNYGSVPTGVGTAGVINGAVLAYTAYYVGPIALALEIFGESQQGRKNYPLAINLYQLGGKGHALVFKMMERALIMPARAAVLGKVGTVMAIFGAGQGLFGLLEYKEEIYNAMNQMGGVPIKLALESMSREGLQRLVVDTVTFSASPGEYVALAQEAFEAKQDGDNAQAIMAVRAMEARLSRYQ
ncbi:MAG: Ig-like domain-containing protein [Opitutaceae bacterium]